MIYGIIAAVIFALWVFYLLLRGLKAGSDYDDRMRDIVNGRYKYPKK